jgi:hypothetical protein
MKEAMTKRERVEATLKGVETDRVPLYDIILNDDVIRHFTGSVPAVGEAGAKLQCKAIGEMLDMTRMAGIGPAEPGEYSDDDGFVYHRNRWTSGGILKRPFEDEKGAQKWLQTAIRRIEDSIRDFDANTVRQAFLEHFHRIADDIGDDTVILGGQSGTGLDAVRFSLGLELFSYVDADAPDLISEFLELSTDHEVMVIEAIADSQLSPCALTFGDIACKGRLLHSPAWLRREFMPRLARLNAAWHNHGVSCLFHSDGDLLPVMQDLIDAGIDGFNPIETAAGITIESIREEFGDQIFLAGGIDISTLMSFGTPEDVRTECRKAIHDAGRGFFMGSTTEIDPGSKLENVLAMYEVSRES